MRDFKNYNREKNTNGEILKYKNRRSLFSNKKIQHYLE